MATEENKALIHRWYEGVSRGDASVTAELVGPDYQMNGQPLGPQGGSRSRRRSSRHSPTGA